MKERNIPITSLEANSIIEGIEWADNHPISNGKELLYVAQKTAERTRKEDIRKACEWLRHQEEMIGISFEDDFIERFKKALEE